MLKLQFTLIAVFFTSLGAISPQQLLANHSKPPETHCSSALDRFESVEFQMAAALSQEPLIQAFNQKGYPSRELVHGTLLTLVYWAKTEPKIFENGQLQSWLLQVEHDPISAINSVRNWSGWRTGQYQKAYEKISILKPSLRRRFLLPKMPPPALAGLGQSWDAPSLESLLKTQPNTATEGPVGVVFSGGDVALMHSYFLVNRPFFTEALTEQALRLLSSREKYADVKVLLQHRLSLFRQYNYHMERQGDFEQRLGILYQRRALREHGLHDGQQEWRALATLSTEDFVERVMALCRGLQVGYPSASIINAIGSDFINGTGEFSREMMSYAFPTFRLIHLARGEIQLSQSQHDEMLKIMSSTLSLFLSYPSDVLREYKKRGGRGDIEKYETVYSEIQKMFANLWKPMAKASLDAPFNYISQEKLKELIGHFELLRASELQSSIAAADALLVRPPAARAGAMPYR